MRALLKLSLGVALVASLLLSYKFIPYLYPQLAEKESWERLGRAVTPALLAFFLAYCGCNAWTRVFRIPLWFVALVITMIVGYAAFKLQDSEKNFERALFYYLDLLYIGVVSLSLGLQDKTPQDDGAYALSRKYYNK